MVDVTLCHIALSPISPSPTPPHHSAQPFISDTITPTLVFSETFQALCPTPKTSSRLNLAIPSRTKALQVISSLFVASKHSPSSALYLKSPMTSLLQSLKLLKLILTTSLRIPQDVCTHQWSWTWMRCLFVECVQRCLHTRLGISF
jgi:hypothetical protein